MINDNIVKAGGDIMLNNDHFLVNFSLGNFCNYSCSYCWPGVSSGEFPFQHFSYYNNFIDKLKDKIIPKGYNNLSILFTGGEPTAYKFLPKVVKHFCNSDKSINNNVLMNTNLSPGLLWWDKFLKISRDASTTFIVASYHHEFSDLNSFISKCKFLKQSGVGIMVRKVVSPSKDDLDFCIDLFNKFEDNGIYFEMKPYLHIAPLVKGSKYVGKKIHENFTPEMMDRLSIVQSSSKYKNDAGLINVTTVDEFGNKSTYLSEQNLFYSMGLNFEGWNCYAGASHLAINSNGDVRRCFDIKGKDNLGNIFTQEDFTLFDGPKPCPVSSCSCITCLLAQKERINVQEHFRY